MNKLFVWDLHGTLEKGTERTVTMASNDALAHFGTKVRFQQEQMNRLFGKKLHECFATILPESSREELLALEQKTIDLFFGNADYYFEQIFPTDHAYTVLNAIQDAGHEQLLLSNAEERGILAYMQHLDLDQFFGPGQFCATNKPNDTRRKPDYLRDYLNNKQFSHIVAIGDAPHDIELANVAGGTSYLYTHPHMAFRDCDPDYRIRDLRDVLREL